MTKRTTNTPAKAGIQLHTPTPLSLDSGFSRGGKSKERNERGAYIWYSLVALAVLLPMLAPGFIFTLDFVFAPDLPMPSGVTSSYLFHAMLHLLNFVLPGDVIQKILLFAILLTSAIGMHKLIRSISPAKNWGIGVYIASIFFTINPFTYSRFMAGQFAVLLGYALLPWLVRAAVNFGKNPAARQTIALGMVATLTAIVSIHMVVAMAILGIVATGIAYTHRRKQLGVYGKRGLVAFGIFLALSSYWLVPLALGKGATAQTIQSFTSSDTGAFATTGDNVVARGLSIVRLQGFWAERRDLYLLPQDRVVLWGLMGMLILVLVVVGAKRLWRTRPAVVLLLGGSGLIALLLAAGVAGQAINAVGLREPHKLVALVALAYAVFLAYGVEAVLTYASKKHTAWYGATAVCLLVLPFAYMRVMLWGFDGQLTSRHYPADWYALKDELGKRPEGTVLFLPWHQYMTFRFAGRIIANPAPIFFGPRMLISPDPELEGAQGRPPSAQEKSIAKLLASTDKTTFSSQLSEQNVSYIVLAKELDYSSYAYLGRLPHIELIKDSTTFTLYKNQAWGEMK